MNSLLSLMPKLKAMGNKTVNNYLKFSKWKTAHIKEGLRQAEAGEFAKKSEVSSVLARGRKNRKKSA